MAISIDLYMMCLGFPSIEPTIYKPIIVQRMINFGAGMSVISTGWGSAGSGQATILVIYFESPKNTFTDAQVAALAQNIGSDLGTSVYRVCKLDAQDITI